MSALAPVFGITTREALEAQRAEFTRHGGAEDRGSADAYYERGIDPHYYTGATYSSERVEITDKASPEYAAYMRGYDGQRDRKDWG